MTKKKKFLRLHVHSVHSARDAMLPVKTIVEDAIEHNEIPSLTDHGSIAGAIEFIDECEKNNIVGAIGCEFYINKNIDRLIELKDLIANEKDTNKKKKLQNERDDKRKHSHLLILAKNTHGFYNILRLNNLAYINGFYHKPTINYDELFSMKPDKNGDYGVIVTSACMASPLGKYILNNDIDSATDWCQLMKDYFGEDFYLEVQTNKMKEQKIINKKIIEISKKLNIKMCIGNDAHYLKRNWADTHQDLLLLQNKNTRSDLGKIDYRVTWENGKGEEKSKKIKAGKDFRKGTPIEKVKVGDEFGKGKNKDKVIAIKEIERAWSFSTNESYYKSEKQLRIDVKSSHKELEKVINKIIDGNKEILSKVEEVKPNKVNKLPKIDGGYEKLVAFVKKSLKEKQQNNELHRPLKKYVERVKYELGFIKERGYENYFLILADLMYYVRKNNIPMGVARGSAGGSLVAYLIGIHRLDPLDTRWSDNGLRFERFLNPSRSKGKTYKFYNENNRIFYIHELEKVKILRNKEEIIAYPKEIKERDEIISRI